MIKKATFIFIILSFLNVGSASALNSSSYLISKIAFQLNDFETVLNQFEINDNSNLSDYRDQMISFIILEDYELANQISLKILKDDEEHQEAKMVNFAFSLLNNLTIDDLIIKYKFDQNDFINFIFFNDNKLKTFKEISNSFIQIVQTNYYDYENEVDEGKNRYLKDKGIKNNLIMFMSNITYFASRHKSSGGLS